MSCTVSCQGFGSVTAACAKKPCLTDGLCRLIDPGITDCRAWCCEYRGWNIAIMTIFFAAGLFGLCAMYYLHRLHLINAQAIVVDASGGDATDAAYHKPAGVQRTKRRVVVDKSLLENIRDVDSV